jgi:hypothetical protein
VLGAKWGEINLTERLWTIPAERMKAGKEHRAPLSDAAMAILDKMQAIRSGDYVFPGRLRGRSLSSMSLLVVMRGMGRRGLTTHGFRSSFRDWAAERTAFPAEVAEMALAHTVADAVERAYRRGDLFEKRRQLAEAWATFCAAPSVGADVVPNRGGALQRWGCSRLANRTLPNGPSVSRMGPRALSSPGPRSKPFSPFNWSRRVGTPHR